jgi:hypothetical protein
MKKKKKKEKERHAQAKLRRHVAVCNRVLKSRPPYLVRLTLAEAHTSIEFLVGRLWVPLHYVLLPHSNNLGLYGAK